MERILSTLRKLALENSGLYRNKLFVINNTISLIIIIHACGIFLRLCQCPVPWVMHTAKRDPAAMHIVRKIC
jgi:hypothetical protein